MANVKTEAKPAIQLTTISESAIPAQKRKGRSSKFVALFERVSKLGKDQAVSFSIEKYTQVQGMRKRLNELGFTVTTRSDAGKLTAYIYHTPVEPVKA